jgi:hypothetical protein
MKEITEKPQVDYSIYRKILEMVRELHRRGYECLRICPGMAASGVYWRCMVTPVTNILSTHGAMAADWGKDKGYFYTSADREKYFHDKLDVSNLSPSKMADYFLEHYSRIAEAGFGKDEMYAQWFEEMLRLTEPHWFPISYADWDCPSDRLQTTGPRPNLNIFVPLPPPGLAEKPFE